MKAIKDCKWKVYIFENNIDTKAHGFYYYVKLSQNTGLKDFYIVSKKFKTEKGCKLNFIKFAKLNKIKNWKFV